MSEELPQITDYVDVDLSDVPVVHELAAARGVAVAEVPERGMEPVTIVTLILMGSATAVSGVRHVLERRRGGQVIDLRPGALKAFYRTTDLEYGIVVIFASDGTATVRIPKLDDALGMISALPQLLRGVTSAQRAARAVTEKFGSDVQVETEEDPGRDGAG